MRLACPGLFSWLEKKATIVTPTPLLSSAAAHQVAMHRIREGRESWERTPIYSVDAWLVACWQQARYAADAPLLLSPSQELALWQSIVEDAHPRLFDPNAAARLARRAARLVSEWSIPAESDAWNDHEDGQQFHAWLTQVRAECREQGWCTRADLLRLLPKWIEQGVCGREPIVFAAFEVSIPPALERVKLALGSAAHGEPAAKPLRNPAHPAKSFDNFSDELEHAARVARAAFEQDPARSIAVFVTDLREHRALVHRIFEDVFYPSRPLRAEREHSAFHVAAGAPLVEQPIVANALLLLELAQPRIDHAKAGAILRSPFISGAFAERNARALADLDLRKRRDLEVSFRDLEAASRTCPALMRVWAATEGVLSKMPKRADLPVWSEFISDLLGACGWPGDAALSVLEEQTIEQWKDALSSLASLGLVSPRLSYNAALAHLRRLLTAPGPEIGDWFSPVQILDASDAAGLEFDQAIVTGLSDETWPPANEISPLIPWRLQRAYAMPSTTAQGARAERERLTQALFQSAPFVLATYSGRLSPVAERYTRPNDAEVLLWRGKQARQSFAPVSLEEADDSRAPAFESREPARGGTSLIRAQSLCPFRAFAEYRLRASAPEDACFGFDARDRGGFVHAALRLVWRELQSQGRLRAIPEDELRAIVSESVTQAVADDRSSALHHLASSAERERLEALIVEWLRLERGRKQSFTVETVEEERYYEVPGLRLRLRVDRVDRLQNGSVLLIDYKSGQQTRNKLLCPRPPEPQLLIYAAASGDNVDGVFFGELKPRAPRAVGFSREKHFDGSSVTVLKNGWDAFREESSIEVERLAKEFVSGYAAVDPLNGACQYCRIKPLCRVNETGGGDEEQE
jgi:ATP-dependent helicase/nuclease subunit B